MKPYPLKMHNAFCIVFSALFFFLSLSIEAQKKKKDSKNNVVTEAPKPKEKSIKDLIKSSKKIEGLFTLYRDTITGSLHMLIYENQINNEFIYFSQISDGVADVGRIIRGSYNDSKVFKIEKFFDRIEFIVQNTSFYFDPENPLSKSKDANTSQGNLASIKIEAHDKTEGAYLIKADDLFLSEVLSQIKNPSLPGESPTAFKLGHLDKSKTKIRNIKNYPENTDVEVEYNYTSPAVINSGSNALADGRNVSIKVYHSLLAIPENDYEIRFDDPRVGYFTTQVENQTSTNSIPYRDLIPMASKKEGSQRRNFRTCGAHNVVDRKFHAF